MDNTSFDQTTHKLTIETNEGGADLVISVRPNYMRDILGFVLALAFAIPLCIASGIPGQSGLGVWWFIVILLFILVFQSVYVKRWVKFVVRRNLQTIEYQRSGFLGTPLFARSLEFPFSEIAGFEIRNFSQRHFYRFQILAVFKSGERLDLFGKDLGNIEHQSVMETIRSFTGMPVKAIPKRRS